MKAYPDSIFTFVLKQTEFKIFINHSSASEVGTSRASINRTGKTNAAKGVENHYNEYSEFHARETEAHICASFMAMTGMDKISGKNMHNLITLYLSVNNIINLRIKY